MDKAETFRTSAVILASGSGSRFGSDDCPKHLTKIGGVPVIIWTLSSVLNSKIFDKVVIVTKESDLAPTNMIISEFFDSKKLGLLSAIGGDERIESFFNGVLEISRSEKINNNDLIALIDSNRPFCSVQQILDLNNLAFEYGCSCPARPVVNGVAKISKDTIIDVPDKEKYVEFVTPEFIQYEILKKSKNKAYKSLVEYSLGMSIQPRFIASSDLNSKLTYPEDLYFLESVASKYNIPEPTRKK